MPLLTPDFPEEVSEEKNLHRIFKKSNFRNKYITYESKSY